MAAIQLNENTFDEEVLKSDKPVLVDFWAPWCGPCKMMVPIVEQLADKVPNVKFCKVNVDENQDLAQKYDVMSIPNFKLFKNGQLVGEEVGAIGEEGLLKLIQG